MGKKWTEYELTILKETYAKTRIKDIKRLLPTRTAKAIQNKAYDLRLKPRSKRWGEKEIKTLHNYKYWSIKDIQESLLPHRTYGSIKQKMDELGIRVKRGRRSRYETHYYCSRCGKYWPHEACGDDPPRCPDHGCLMRVRARR